MKEIPFSDYAGLTERESQTLREGPGRLLGLDDIFEWGRRQSPPVHPSDVIRQDEFTHDVLVPLGEDRWLVYGTT